MSLLQEVGTGGGCARSEWSAKALANLYPKIVKKLMALPLPICRLLLQFCIGSRSALARIKVYLLSFLMLSTTVLSSERWKEKMDKLDSSTRCFKSMIDEVALLFMSENESHFSVLYLICTTEQVKMDLYYKAMSNMSGNLYRIAGKFSQGSISQMVNLYRFCGFNYRRRMHSYPLGTIQSSLFRRFNFRG